MDKNRTTGTQASELPIGNPTELAQQIVELSQGQVWSEDQLVEFNTAYRHAAALGTSYPSDKK